MLLHIVSRLQTPGGTPEKFSETYKADMKSDGDGYTFVYREHTGSGECDCRVQVCGDRVAVTRSGAESAVMVFCEGLCHTAVYEAGGYRFDLVLETKTLHASLSPAGGTVNLVYTLTLGGEVRECEMHMKLKGVC